MVAKNNKIRVKGCAFIFQQGVTQPSGRVFNAKPLIVCQRTHVCLPHCTGYTHAVTKMKYKISILCRFCP